MLIKYVFKTMGDKGIKAMLYIKIFQFQQISYQIIVKNN